MSGYQELRIGDKYARISGRAEGCFMDHPDVFELIANYSNPEREEIEHYHENHPFEIRFCTIGGVIFFIFKADGEPWQDAPFTPHLASNKEYDEVEDGKGYTLMLMLTDAPSGTIRSMRAVGLGTEFSRKLREEILNQLNYPFDVSKYFRSIDMAYAKYSTKDMLKFVLPGCRYKIN